MVLVYNLADTFFIGQTHNALLVAAVSLATPVYLIFMSLGTLFGIGGTSVISRALGEGKKEKARKSCAFCFWGNVVRTEGESIRLRDFTVKQGIAASVLAIGVPAALGDVLMSVSQIIINSQISHYGDMAVTGMTGLVWAQPVADVLSILIAAILLGKTMKKMQIV